jgi:hypothetical protein
MNGRLRKGVVALFTFVVVLLAQGQPEAWNRIRIGGTGDWGSVQICNSCKTTT